MEEYSGGMQHVNIKSNVASHPDWYQDHSLQLPPVPHKLDK